MLFSKPQLGFVSVFLPALIFLTTGDWAVSQDQYQRIYELTPIEQHFRSTPSDTVRRYDESLWSSAESSRPISAPAWATQQPTAHSDSHAQAAELPVESFPIGSSQSPVRTASGTSLVPEEVATRVPAEPASDDSARVTISTVEERLAELEASELAADVKSAAQAHYEQASEFLHSADDARTRTAGFRAETENGPQSIDDATSQLAEPLGPPDPVAAENARVAELQQLQLADESRLTAAVKALEEWEQREANRTERKPQLPGLVERTSGLLANALRDLEAPVPEGEPPAVALARMTELEAYVVLLEEQLELYQVEMARNDALAELFPLQRDLLMRNRNYLESRCASWTTIVLEAGRREAEQQAAEARRALQDAHPELRELATRNAELTQRRTDLQDLLATTRDRVAAIDQTLQKLQDDFEDIQDKERRAGLTTAIGLLLRNQRNDLPDEDVYFEHRRDAVSLMGRLQIEQMPLNDERDHLSDTAALAAEIVAEIDENATRAGVNISEMALSLLNNRKKYLSDLLNDYDSCIGELAELDVRSRKLIETTSEYRNYIDERVLWIRSANMIGIDTSRRALVGLADVMATERWQRIATAVCDDVLQNRWWTALFLFGIVLLLGLRFRLRTWTESLFERARGQSFVGAFTTIVALLLTLAIASVWPLLLWLVGGRLATGIASEFGVVVGTSLQTTAIVFWSVEIFRQICRSGGIASRHLNWPESAMQSLHRSLLTLMSLGLPIVFGAILAEHWRDGVWADSLGRFLFITGMLLLAASIAAIARPNGRVLREVLDRHRDGWLYRTRRIWYPLAVSVPLLLGGMAVAGFQFTAQQLLIRVEATFWLLIILLIAFSLAMRWLVVVRQHLAKKQAMARRAALKQSEQSTETHPLPHFEEPKADISLLSAQMLKFVRAMACVLFLTGSWFIWGEVLPALQVFNRVELWHTTVQVAEEVELTEGVSETRMVTRPRAITFGSLLLAASILIVSVVASRNIPGLMELVILQRLPMDSGGRNAITTLCRYLLSMGGLILTASTLGIGWSSVQWLIAALTVGLGFGLQEIFANFVSGLIILFERPVRIGDVVTIDGVSGSVSRIQIRATTITDFDRKEYIVPNKEFVTGRVLNWTLTDKTNRIVVTVGVAYGSNTELARSLLVKVATENPNVLETPAPTASFEGFGDSCLTLLLRCYLPNLDNRLNTITQLHEAIDREFAANGLEIAFPQRDIHVRSMIALPAAVANSSSSEQTAYQQRNAA